MRILPPGSKPNRPHRSNNGQSGSILIDAVVAMILVTILGFGILMLLGQTFSSMKDINSSLDRELENHRQASSQLW